MRSAGRISGREWEAPVQTPEAMKHKEVFFLTFVLSFIIITVPSGRESLRGTWVEERTCVEELGYAWIDGGIAQRVCNPSL